MAVCWWRWQRAKGLTELLTICWLIFVFIANKREYRGYIDIRLETILLLVVFSLLSLMLPESIVKHLFFFPLFCVNCYLKALLTFFFALLRIKIYHWLMSIKLFHITTITISVDSCERQAVSHWKHEIFSLRLDRFFFIIYNMFGDSFLLCLLVRPV